MSLESIFYLNTESAEILTAKKINLKSLFQMCSDLCWIIDSLNFDSQDLRDFIINLRLCNPKFSNYSNTSRVPSKILITNPSNNLKILFSLHDSSDSLYSCNLCSTALKKKDLQSHVSAVHNI